MSQQGKLLRLAARAATGKPPIVRVAGVPLYHFVSVRWGGTSPLVCLRSIATGEASCKTAADWKRSGVDL